MKQRVFLVLVFLALTVMLDNGLAFDKKQGGTRKSEDNYHTYVNKVSCAIEVALDKTGKSFEKAGDKTGQALGRARKKIWGWFDG